MRVIAVTGSFDGGRLCVRKEPNRFVCFFDHFDGGTCEYGYKIVVCIGSKKGAYKENRACVGSS